MRITECITRGNSTSLCHNWRNRLLLVSEFGCPARWTAHVCMTYKTYTAPKQPYNHRLRFNRLVLLVLLIKEVPGIGLVHEGSASSGEFAHLMKSASSELEALMGGVAVAVGLEEPPDRASLVPTTRVPNQAMASCHSC